MKAFRGHTDIYFRDVVSITEAAVDGSNLFPNIVIAEGANREEKSEYAREALTTVPGIDSVIIFPDPDEAMAPLPLEALQRAAQKHRFKVDIERPKFHTAGAVLGRLHRFFTARGFFKDAADPEEKGRDIEQVAALISSQHAAVDINQRAPVQRTLMTYCPFYKCPQGPDDFINGHIDQREGYDLRRIDCRQGSGTILFKQSDFDIEECSESGLYRYNAMPKVSQFRCISLPLETSVVIRVVSPRLIEKGLLPTFHAHGIGITSEPEERLTFRHDMILAV